MFTYVRWKKFSKNRTWIHWCSSRNTPQGLLKVRSPIPKSFPCNQINQVHRSGIREVHGLLESVLWNFSLGRSSWKSLRLLFAVGLFLQFVCVFAVYLDKLGVCPNKLQMRTNCKFTLLTEVQSHNISCGWDIALSELLYLENLGLEQQSFERWALIDDNVFCWYVCTIGFCRDPQDKRNVLETMTWRWCCTRS